MMRSTRKDDRRALTKAMMDLAEAYDLDIDEDGIPEFGEDLLHFKRGGLSVTFTAKRV